MVENGIVDNAVEGIFNYANELFLNF